MTMADWFRSDIVERYSFGYPVYPNLPVRPSRHLDVGPAEIGAHLAEAMTMNQDAIVRALGS